jgi:membrane protein YdbS with pleckstrin-like domain
MTLLLLLHSLNRWLIVVASILAIYFLVKNILAKTSLSKNARVTASIFTGLMDLQLLLGLAVYVLPVIPISRVQNEHAGIMVLAVIVAHMPAMFRKKDSTTYPALMLAAVVTAMILIILGIVPIGGLVRWTHIIGLF